MTRVRARIDRRFVPIIEAETPQKCDLCGKAAETRPYGPNGEEVCYDCGMKDEKAAGAAFGRFLNGRR